MTRFAPPVDWMPARRGVLAAAIMMGLTLLMFGDVLFARDPPMLTASGTDVMLQFAPFRQFGFDHLRHGDLPLWNPYCFSGMPFLGTLQAALLYPPNWVHLILPLKHAVNWDIALHVFLAGWFTSLWCLGHGVQLVGALLAGMMFVFGTPYFLHLYAGHLPFLCVATWIPMLLLSLDRMRESHRVLRWTLLGGAVVAMQSLAGYPQLAYYTALIAAPYQAWLARRSPGRRAIFAGFVGMYVIGVAISAIQILPGLALYPESVRAGGLSYEFAATFSMPFENFLTLLSPHVLGDMSPAHPYFGRWFLWEVSMFVGVVGLTIAAIGGTCARRPVASVARTMVVVLVILSLGDNTFVFRVLYDYVPGFRTFRASGRWFVLAALFLALLAGLGWNRLVDGDARLGRWAAMCAVAASLVGVLALVFWVSVSNPTTVAAQAIDRLRQSPQAALTAAQRTDPQWIEASGRQVATQLIVPTGLLLLVATVLTAARRRRPLLAVLPIVGGFELFLFAYSDRATFDTMPPLPAAWSAELAAPGDHRFWFPEPTYFNAGMRANVSSIWGYDPIILRRYAEFMAWTQGVDPDKVVDAYHLPFRRTPPVLSILRARAVLTSEPTPQVVSLSNPMPRLALVHEWVHLTSRDEILRAITADEFDPRRTVVLESVPDPLPAPASGPEWTQLVRATTDELEIEVEVAQPAILVVTDSYSAGWRALPLADGKQKEYRVLPADYVLRGIPLAAGRHHLLLQYSPLAYRAGRWVSLIAVLGWAVLVVIESRLSRRRRLYRAGSSSAAASAVSPSGVST